MKHILFALLPVALLAACETLPNDAGYPAAEAQTPAPEELAGGPEDPAEMPDPTPATEAAPAVVAKQTYIQYRRSPLVHSLVSESVMNDDVALMGLLSGARIYCGLDWQPGFVSFVNLANRQGLNLERVADDHGYYMGAAYRALKAAEHTCSDDDLVDLRAIDPY